MHVVGIGKASVSRSKRPPGRLLARQPENQVELNHLFSLGTTKTANGPAPGRNGTLTIVAPTGLDGSHDNCSSRTENICRKRNCYMELSAPTKIIFILSLALAIISLLPVIGLAVPVISIYSYWILFVAFVLLAAANLLKGL